VRGLRQALAQARPAVLYFHPWEFDPLTPRMPMGRLGQWRTYTGLGRSMAKLDRILGEFGSWTTLEHVAPSLRGKAEQRPAYTLQQAA